MFVFKICYTLTLILVTLLFYFGIKKILAKRWSRAQKNLNRLKGEYKRLFQKSRQLKEQNHDWENKLEKIVALYDITKQICQSLDQDTVFDNFYSQLKRYIDFSDCKFFRQEAYPLAERDDIVLPLKIHRRPAGYLVARGIKPQEKDKFHILSQQFFLGAKRAFFYQQIQELAITDSLTGVSSRRYSLERLQEEIQRSSKLNYCFSYLMADIDYFKTCNDRYGHLVGDAILKEVANCLKENVRQIDIVGRYGGEEFCVIMSETDREAAVLAAERIRQAMEQKLVRIYDEYLKATISIGISVFPDDAKDLQALIERADQALYKAKETGRNKVCVYSGSA